MGLLHFSSFRKKFCRLFSSHLCLLFMFIFTSLWCPWESIIGTHSRETLMKIEFLWGRDARKGHWDKNKEYKFQEKVEIERTEFQSSTYSPLNLMKEICAGGNKFSLKETEGSVVCSQLLCPLLMRYLKKSLISNETLVMQEWTSSHKMVRIVVQNMITRCKLKKGNWEFIVVNDSESSSNPMVFYGSRKWAQRDITHRQNQVFNKHTS
jgi:hypothetical protein